LRLGDRGAHFEGVAEVRGHDRLDNAAEGFLEVLLSDS
jgi:hypothetical protein